LKKYLFLNEAIDENFSNKMNILKTFLIEIERYSK
jgi:hypothetical protein